MDSVPEPLSIDSVSAEPVENASLAPVGQSPPDLNSTEAVGMNELPLRIMALHALLYCERLFYLEEVEEIRVADAAVYAGRRLHDELAPLEDETPEQRRFEVASEKYGLVGIADAIRKRDGQWIAYEHKRGRSRRDDQNQPQAWPSDRLQAIAYALLIEEALGEPVPQARVRYHAENVTAFIEIDEAAREELHNAIRRARELRLTTERPPVHPNEHVCRRCSLAPVCLPEEERLSGNSSSAADAHIPTLFPSNRQRETLHVCSPRAVVSRSGETLIVTSEEDKQAFPIQDVDSVVVHGFGQVTTQAIQLCARHGISVLWMTAGGKFSAGTSASPGRVQQRIRQYQALTQPEIRLRLTRQLVHAKVETQLRYLLRGTRGDETRRPQVQEYLDRIRETLRKIPDSSSPDSLRGLEGMAAKSYFASLPQLLAEQTPIAMIPRGRSKHPPQDRFNCLLSFGYALIQTLVQKSILAVGLEPAFGFFHQPRTSAPPLVLDLMELFRTPLWEMPLVGSVNRGQWNPELDFEVNPGQIWLTQSGRQKAIQLFEQRLQEAYKHPHTGQSLTYARFVELEVRLLEKEWTGCPGLFAQWRMR